MFSKWYRRLYNKLGGRPWTYIARDIYHQYELLIIAIWFWTGVAIGIHLGLKVAAIWFGAFAYGYLNGHLHWGEKWIKGQDAKGDK